MWQCATVSSAAGLSQGVFLRVCVLGLLERVRVCSCGWAAVCRQGTAESLCVAAAESVCSWEEGNEARCTSTTTTQLST